MSVRETVLRNPKRSAVIGVGGLIALLGSCGIGAAVSSPAPMASPPTTITQTEVLTETTTVTATPTTSEQPVKRTTTREPRKPRTTTEESPRVRAAVPRRTRTPRPAPTTESDASYANCGEARAAGAAPLLQGQPGYRSKLDRDGDGVACE
ncbi:excalibur calcium-binding domain-containing protein [Gordonia malaquae]|uniref:excalibur calcium-binding domain-containing protein n=1 Tax=Gordonia malaquae TaxID=410332 RepID=UPI00034682B0|nr:excalibur calcium-binding domain-containing protein [Gordonia malaquae]